MTVKESCCLDQFESGLNQIFCRDKAKKNKKQEKAKECPKVRVTYCNPHVPLTPF